MLADTIEELRTVALASDDASGYFPAMYARVTDRIQRAASAGEFGDGDGMMQFARSFARWYLRPRNGATQVPGPWRAAWDEFGRHPVLGVDNWSNGWLPSIFQGTVVRSQEPRILNLDPPLVLAPNDFIEYQCTHDNGVSREVRRCGDSYLDKSCTPGEPLAVTFNVTAQDEMCLLTGLYY